MPQPVIDAVGVGPLLDAAVVRPVAGEHVELVERARVEQVLDALAGEQLALVVLALDRPLGPGVEGFFLALLEILEALAHGVLRHSEVARYRAPPAGAQRDAAMSGTGGRRATRVPRRGEASTGMRVLRIEPGTRPGVAGAGAGLGALLAAEGIGVVYGGAASGSWASSPTPRSPAAARSSA